VVAHSPGNVKGDVVIPSERDLLDELPQEPFVIDVGANIGEFTGAVLDRRPKARVLAIEPQAEALRRLRDRYPGVSTVCAAAGVKSEQRMLHSDAPDSYLATFHPRPHMPMIRTVPVGEVSVLPLSDLVAGEARIDLLKIDVEGHELEVVQGAVPILHRVDVILFEHFEDESRYTDDSLNDFDRVLASGGFRVERLREPHGPTHMCKATKERK
jgi:FkbM family methyltransferase